MRKFKAGIFCAALMLSIATVGFAQTAAPAADGPTSSAEAKAKADQEVDQKAAEWVTSLNLNDAAKEKAVKAVVATHLKLTRDYYNTHPGTDVPAGINPSTGKLLSAQERQIISISAMPVSIHQNLMTGLRQNLNDAQVEAILDKYTIGKVAFTMSAYKAIVPNMTAEEENVILTNLKIAREQAVDYKNMKLISAIFEIYKDKNELYLNTHGRSWREMYKTYTDAAKAKKAADKAAKEQQAAKSPQ